MIEVIVFDPTGRRCDSAEAVDPENAIYAGQVIYDEAVYGRRARRYSVGFYVDGKLVRLIEGRPERGVIR